MNDDPLLTIVNDLFNTKYIYFLVEKFLDQISFRSGNIQVIYLNIQVIYLNIQVIYLNIQVIYLNIQVIYLNIQVIYLNKTKQKQSRQHS